MSNVSKFSKIAIASSILLAGTGFTQVSVDSQSSKAEAASYCKATVVYMTKKDILKQLDHMDKTNKFNWQSYLSNPISDAALAWALARVTSQSYWAAFAAGTLWAASDLLQREHSWWQKTTELVLRGKIKGVKKTIKPNCTGSNYPAAFIKIERY